MAVDSLSTFDQDPPHRPAPSEIGSGAKENAPPPLAPDPIRMPIAEEFNHMRNLLAKLGVEMPLARLYLTFPGGTPSVSIMFCAREDMVAADFLVVENGDGDTTISWATGPGGKLPPPTGGPTVSIAALTDVDRFGAFYTSVGGNPAVRIKTRMATGVGVDCPVVVTIY